VGKRSGDQAFKFGDLPLGIWVPLYLKGDVAEAEYQAGERGRTWLTSSANQVVIVAWTSAKEVGRELPMGVDQFLLLKKAVCIF
jgi:hypothetical protein